MVDGLNPAIFTWARDTAGLTIGDAANLLDLGDARGVSGADRLAALERGEGAPSRPLLLRMAKVYRQPLLTFYLGEPPRRQPRGEDFRTLPPEQATADAALVDSLLRDIRSRQEMVKSLLLEDDDFNPLSFIGSLSMRDGPDEVLSSVVETLELDRQRYRSGKPGGFAYLRAQAEKAGIFVLLIGNLGSHHSALDVELFRGFALADKVAPFIVINDQDAEAAWSFSLMHELCHLWIGLSGVSGARAGSPVEVFCNDFAARFFFGPDDNALLQSVRGAGLDQARAAINDIAERLNVSRSAVAYKMLRDEIITREAWSALTGLFRQQWLRGRQDRRDARPESASGPSYYVVRRHRVGHALLDHTRNWLKNGDLSPSKAGTILGVRPSNVYPLLEIGGSSGGRA